MKFQLSETIWWWIEPCGEAPFHISYRGVSTRLAKCLNSVLNVKALVAAFNQEKALVEAFSVIVHLRLAPCFPELSRVQVPSSTHLRNSSTGIFWSNEHFDWTRS